MVHPEDRDADLEQLQRLLAGEATGHQLQQRCRRVDGEAISVLCNTWLVTDRHGGPLHLDPGGRPRYLVRQLVDLREGRHPEDQLAWRTTHDTLTGLPNRSLFLDRLEMTLARLGRDPALAAVLLLGLDRFKEVTGRFGDDAVDRLLVAVAGRLRSILRPSDTVSRFGSDEFAVLCPDLAHERDAVRLAERMTAGLATPFAVGGQEIVVTASIGIALTGSRTRRASCAQPRPARLRPDLGDRPGPRARGRVPSPVRDRAGVPAPGGLPGLRPAGPRPGRRGGRPGPRPRAGPPQP